MNAISCSFLFPRTVLGVWEPPLSLYLLYSYSNYMSTEAWRLLKLPAVPGILLMLSWSFGKINLFPFGGLWEFWDTGMPVLVKLWGAVEFLSKLFLHLLALSKCIPFICLLKNFYLYSCFLHSLIVPTEGLTYFNWSNILRFPLFILCISCLR